MCLIIFLILFMLLNLPDDVSSKLLSECLTLSELAKLDSAYCNKENRENLATVFAYYVFQLRVEVVSYKQLHWVGKKHIKMTRLTVCPHDTAGRCYDQTIIRACNLNYILMLNFTCFVSSFVGYNGEPVANFINACNQLSHLKIEMSCDGICFVLNNISAVILNKLTTTLKLTSSSHEPSGFTADISPIALKCFNIRDFHLHMHLFDATEAYLNNSDVSNILQNNDKLAKLNLKGVVESAHFAKSLQMSICRNSLTSCNLYMSADLTLTCNSITLILSSCVTLNEL